MSQIWTVRINGKIYCGTRRYIMKKVRAVMRRIFPKGGTA